MIHEDDNHVTKTALEHYAKICRKFAHTRLAERCELLAKKLQCDETTNCHHNMQVERISP